jgi:hypothetical protein
VATAPAATAWGNQAVPSPAGGPQTSGSPTAQEAGPASGSFLGTAAAAAAGVVGGALLMNSLRGLFGGQQGHGGLNPSGQSGSPWGSGGGSGGDLSRQAGIDDIGRGGTQRAGLFDTAQNEPTQSDDADSDTEGDDDFGDDFGGDIDTA